MSAQPGSPSNSGFSGRLLPLLDALQPCRPLLQLLGACMNALLPAATLRAEPPCQAVGACSVVARLAFILALIPLCGYARAQRLKGVAFASGLPNTEQTAWSAWLHAVTWPCRPAVLLSSWTIGAEPEDLLVALQPYSVRKAPMLCITRVIPLCQEGCHVRVLAVCKGWLLSFFAAFCICFCTLWAASLVFDPVIRSCPPLVTTSTTQPPNRLTTLCNHAGWCTIICLRIPLSRNQGVLGSQGVVLAHLLAAALRATTAIAPVGNDCLPAVQVAQMATDHISTKLSCHSWV